MVRWGILRLFGISVVLMLLVGCTRYLWFSPIGFPCLTDADCVVAGTECVDGECVQKNPLQKPDGEGFFDGGVSIEEPVSVDTGVVDTSVVDERCELGKHRPCYRGVASQEGVGICKAGAQFCQEDGRWSECRGEVFPEKEICDDKDNDCDGQINEGCTPCFPTTLDEAIGNPRAINGLAFRRDGKVLYFGIDHALEARDVASGRLLWRTAAHDGRVQSLVLSGDETMLISASSEDKDIKIWDPQSGKLLRVLKGHTHAVSNLALSLDGKLLASGASGLRLWDPRSGASLPTLPGMESAANIWSLSFLPDNRSLVVTSNEVRLWDVVTKKLTKTFKTFQNSGATTVVSLDGRWLAFANFNDRTPVEIWDLKTLQKSRSITPRKGFAQRLFFHPDNKTLMIGAERLELWDVSGGTFLAAFLTESTHVAADSQGKLLAVGGHNVRLWSLLSRRPLLTLFSGMGPYTGVKSMVLTQNGRWLLTCYPEHCRLWEAKSKKQLKRFDLRPSFRGFPTPAVALTEDAKWLAVSNSSHAAEGLLLYHAEQQAPKFILLKNTYLSSLAFSRDGLLLASSEQNKEVKIFEVSTGQRLQLIQGHTGRVNVVLFHPDGKILATASGDHSVKLWDVQTGKLLRTLSGHTGEVLSIAFSEDGRRLASASVDKTILVWDPKTGEKKWTLRGHTDAVQSVSFHEAGHFLVSASADKTIKYWDLLLGKLARSVDGDVRKIIWAKGAQIATNTPGVTRLWQCPCKPATTRACFTGDIESQDRGSCSFGEQLCSTSGQWEACANEKLPVPEIVDGIDNDCNGKIDD